jgi:hypothetical protein
VDAQYVAMGVPNRESGGKPPFSFFNEQSNKANV